MSQLRLWGGGTRSSVWLVGEPPISQMARFTWPIRPSWIMATAFKKLEHLAALLGADLKHALGLFQHLDDLLAFVDRERQRLFAVNILAGLHRLDGDLGMPMVRCDDGDDVDVLAIEYLAVIALDGDFDIFSGIGLLLFDEG